MVKHLPAMQETWIRSLGQEDPLEKKMETHSNTLVWKIPWMKEPGRLQSMGLEKSLSNFIDDVYRFFCTFMEVLWYYLIYGSKSF